MSSAFSSWQNFRIWLDKLGMFHMELDLARMREALRLLNLRKTPFPVAQVAGTNGKGSTSTFISELACVHGLKTGLFTSPHFISPRERILINGRQVSREQWLREARIIEEACASLKPTYFEFLTLLALRIFVLENVQLAIFEAGLGGRHDATTAISSDLCCFCPIALDHEAVLGHGLAAIASDKADALHSQKMALSAPQFPIAAAILAEKASTLHIPLEFIQPLPDNPATGPGLAGRHQLINAALALAAWRRLADAMGIASIPAMERKALATAFIPGRLQFIEASECHPAFLLDGAHNPHALLALARHDFNPACVIFSALADKDWQNGISGLCCRFTEAAILVPQLSVSRAACACEIAAFINRMRPERAEAFSAPFALLKSLGKAACLAQPDKPVLVCGSLFLLSDFYHLFPKYLSRPGAANENATCP